MSSGSLRELQEQLQSHLLHGDPRVQDRIIGTPRVDARTRLAIYGDAYRLRLLEALRVDFPALHTLAGDAEFERIGRAYIDAHPSGHFSIRYFGRRLGEFLRRDERCRQVAVFAEMAEFEWALGLSFDAPDSGVIGVEDVAAIPPAAWAGMRIALHSSLQRLDLIWNVPGLWNAIADEQAPQAPLAADCPLPGSSGAGNCARCFVPCRWMRPGRSISWGRDTASRRCAKGCAVGRRGSGGAQAALFIAAGCRTDSSPAIWSKSVINRIDSRVLCCHGWSQQNLAHIRWDLPVPASRTYQAGRGYPPSVTAAATSGTGYRCAMHNQGSRLGLTMRRCPLRDFDIPNQRERLPHAVAALTRLREAVHLRALHRGLGRAPRRYGLPHLGGGQPECAIRTIHNARPGAVPAWEAYHGCRADLVARYRSMIERRAYELHEKGGPRTALDNWVDAEAGVIRSALMELSLLG
jgi:hypothetical protein